MSNFMEIRPVGAELYQGEEMFEIRALRMMFGPKKGRIKTDLKETAQQTASLFVLLTKC
jgi:hypothetical protein